MGGFDCSLEMEVSHLYFAAREKGGSVTIHLATRKWGILRDNKLGASAEMAVEGAPRLASICSVHLQPISPCGSWWGLCTPVPRVPWDVGVGSALASQLRSLVGAVLYIRSSELIVWTAALFLHYCVPFDVMGPAGFPVLAPMAHPGTLISTVS